MVVKTVIFGSPRLYMIYLKGETAIVQWFVYLTLAEINAIAFGVCGGDSSTAADTWRHSSRFIAEYPIEFVFKEWHCLWTAIFRSTSLSRQSTDGNQGFIDQTNGSGMRKLHFCVVTRVTLVLWNLSILLH